MAAPAERSCVLATWNQIGNNIEARDAGGLWWKATIIDKCDKGVRTEVTVHLVGFSARHDEKVRGAGAPAGRRMVAPVGLAAPAACPQAAASRRR